MIAGTVVAGLQQTVNVATPYVRFTCLPDGLSPWQGLMVFELGRTLDLGRISIGIYGVGGDL